MNQPCSRFNGGIPQSVRAFTLVELLVVIAIVAVLIAMFLPALGKAREQARRVVCATQLRGLGTAMLVYEQDYLSLPSGIWNHSARLNYPGNQTLRDSYSVAEKSTICPSAGIFRNTVARWNAPVASGGGRMTYTYYGGWGSLAASGTMVMAGSIETGWASGAFRSISQGYGPIYSTLKPGIAKAVPHAQQFLMGDLTTDGPTSHGDVPEMPNHGVTPGAETAEGLNVFFADSHAEWHTLVRGVSWAFWVSNLPATAGSFPNTFWTPKTGIPSGATLLP